MKKIYKEPNKIETETTINVLYSEKMISLSSGLPVRFPLQNPAAMHRPEKAPQVPRMRPSPAPKAEEKRRAASSFMPIWSASAAKTDWAQLKPW